MQAAGKLPQGKGALELIEEATHALRSAGTPALASYYTGSLPFVLAALYFWGDMSQSAFAGQHVVEAALALGLLFIWMKFWQARFAAQLRRIIASTDGLGRLGDDETGTWRSVTHYGHVLISQVAWQPLGLFLLSLATVLTLPFAWAYAFFQNVTVLADSDNRGALPLARKAAHLAMLWPKQNHMVLATLSGFAFFVFLDLAMFVYFLPGLVKMLFGVESVFTRSGTSLLNSTFFAVIAGLTYLCVDPLVKAVYTLRCFYGESLESGEDLKVELRQASRTSATAILVAMILSLAMGMARTSLADEASPSARAFSEPPDVGSYNAEAAEVSPVDLDQAIRRTVQQRKYTWRAPRGKVVEEEDDASEGLLSRFFARVQKLIGRWAKAAGNWLDKILRKLFLPRRQVPRSGAGYSWMVWSQMLLYLLIAAAVAGLGFVAYRVWRERRRRLAVVAGTPIQPPPDLADQNIGPEQLPEDGWSQLGRELLARGEWRLALRAFYLASLAHLAARHLISLARFKSNREYERELRRRAHSLPDLLVCFGESVSVFDRVWYGRQAVDSELVRQFAANVDRVKAAAGT